MKNKPVTHGGKRTGAGRRKRPTAVKKNILIEQASVDFYKGLGDGYLGRGIDEAVSIINRAILKAKQ